MRLKSSEETKTKQFQTKQEKQYHSFFHPPNRVMLKTLLFTNKTIYRISHFHMKGATNAFSLAIRMQITA